MSIRTNILIAHINSLLELFLIRASCIFSYFEHVKVIVNNLVQSGYRETEEGETRTTWGSSRTRERDQEWGEEEESLNITKKRAVIKLVKDNTWESRRSCERTKGLTEETQQWVKRFWVGLKDLWEKEWVGGREEDVSLWMTDKVSAACTNYSPSVFDCRGVERHDAAHQD